MVLLMFCQLNAKCINFSTNIIFTFALKPLFNCSWHLHPSTVIQETQINLLVGLYNDPEIEPFTVTEWRRIITRKCCKIREELQVSKGWEVLLCCEFLSVDIRGWQWGWKPLPLYNHSSHQGVFLQFWSQQSQEVAPPNWGNNYLILGWL